MAMSDKQAAKVTAFVQPSLGPGETIVAVLGQGMKGPSAMSALLSPFLAFLQKPFAVVVTDRRVMLVKLKMAMTGYPPQAVAAEAGRDVVKATFDRGTLSGKLTLTGVESAPTKLSIQTVFRDDAEKVAAALAGNGTAV
jgi:hypothetical protein